MTTSVASIVEKQDSLIYWGNIADNHTNVQTG